MPDLGSRIARLLFALLLLLAAAPASAGTDRWTLAGPPGVVVSSVVFHPRSPATLWVLAGSFLTSTVYKSEDGGATFHSSASGLENFYIQYLAIDPGRPDVLYAAATLNGGNEQGLGVYRSQDGGAHWTLAAGGEDFATTSSLAVAPGPAGAPGVVFVGNLFRLLRSADGGASFQPVIDLESVSGYGAVAPDPRNPGTVYAAALSRRFKSTNFGATWTDLVEDPSQAPFVHDLVVAAGDPQTLYETGDATWRSRDGGATWQGPFPFRGDVLAVDPEDSDTVYGGSTRGLFVSHDGGETFTEVTRGLPPLDYEAASYYQLYAIKTDPARPRQAFACTVQGLFTTADRGRTWQAAPLAGLPRNPVENFRIDPYDPAHWILSSLGTFFESHDRGGTFMLLAGPFQRNAQVNAIEFDPFVRDRLWALALESPSSRSGLYLSKDGGATWGQASDAVVGEALLLPAPRVLLVLESGTRVNRSGDAGHTWRFVARVGNSQRLVRDPRTLRTLYDESGYFRSDDAGRHWRPWHNGSPHQAIGFNPFIPRTTHLVQDDTLLVTRDEGKTFRVAGHLPLTASHGARELLFDRDRRGVLYAATDADGLLRSQDGGVTWEPLNDGLPDSPGGVTNLIQDPVDGRRFYIAPDAGGLFEVEFTGGVP